MATDILNDYPTTDGKPMAETDWQRILMIDLIQTLDFWFMPNPRVYVSGNLLLFYVPGNKRKHVSPDVFVVKGVPKRDRPNYLLWEEGKSPCLAIELTSTTTRHEDLVKKFKLYQDVLKIQEYFLFDPREDYLEPRLQGYRLQRGLYVPIRQVKGRFPSKELDLHLEANGQELRLYDPAKDAWLLTTRERAVQAEERVEAQARKIKAQEQENRGLQEEVARLRRQLNGKKSG